MGDRRLHPATILISGSVADRVGRRNVFIAGLVLFTLSSIAAGLAGSPLVLNLARGVQGLGGAALLATGLALIAVAFPGGRRSTALAIWGAVTAAAVAIGPLIGGAIVDSLGWEWVFFINAPVGVGALALALTRMPESRERVEGRLDLGGAILLSASLAALVLALLRGNSEGWGSALILSLFAGFAIALAAFIATEARVRVPILDLALWRKASTAGASIGIFAVAAAVFAQLLFLSLYLQNILDHGALGAGLRLLPITVASFFSAALSARLAAHLSLRLLIPLGLALCALGLALQTGLDGDSEWTALLLGFIVAGLGVGIVNPTVSAAALGIVTAARSGMASGLNNGFRLIGVSTGIAGLGAIFEARVGSRFAELLPAAPSDAGEAVSTGNLAPLLDRAPEQLHPEIVAAAASAFTAGLNDIFWVAAAIAAAGAVLTAALIRPSEMISSDGPVTS